MNREEKSVFLHKMAPFTLIKGTLSKMRIDDKIMRCVEPSDRKRIIEAMHSGPSGGHFATESTVRRIRGTGYWWPFLVWDVKHHVSNCDQCQRTSGPSFRNHWPLTPIIPLAPFEKWGIDFIGPIAL